MASAKQPVNQHETYHAHVYFDSDEVMFATHLCKQAGMLFDLPIGKVHQKLVGPHPKWSCQISFTNKQFDELILWLEQNRKGLTVLVHGVTGDDIKDHTDYAYWLGKEVKLNLSFFGI